MSKAIKKETYDEAVALAKSGDTIGAWSILASEGDNYAVNAAEIINENSASLSKQLVENIWISAGERSAYNDGTFEKVANLHLNNYLETMFEKNQQGNLEFTGILPNTKQIENSYKTALKENNVSPNAAIDLVINTVNDAIYGESPDGIISDIIPHWATLLDVFDSTWGWRDQIDSSRVVYDYDNKSNYSDPTEAFYVLLVAGYAATNTNIIETISNIIQDLPQNILNLFSDLILGKNAYGGELIQNLESLQQSLTDKTNQANQFIAPPVRRDPLAFDLDGDGIEITNTSNGVMFDHNNNNVKTNTAWLSGDDAWLTLDKNKNGVIDNGAELFGDNTIKQDGTTAKDGIDALKDLDNNQDGIINNQDIQFANLKLWQDTNQDGVSQQTELKTLSELGIKSIDLTRTGKNQQLTDAIQSDGLTFTKTDGTLGEVAELDLNQNEFFSKFTADGDFNTKEFNLKGTGLVRDLAGATSEDKTLSTLVSKLQATTNINEQTNTLDKVLYQ
jgi:hypothetical protein